MAAENRDDHSHIEHLKMIQTIIARMGQNSFVLKGWSVTVATGILAAAAAGRGAPFALLALVPALSFWGLDAFYLRQERVFRALHDDACTTFGKDPVTLSLDTRRVAPSVASWGRTLFSKTVFWLHGPLVVVVLIVAGVLSHETVRKVVSCLRGLIQ